MPGFTVEYSVKENGRKAPQYTIDTDFDGELSLAEFLEYTKSTLIIVAAEVLKEEQDKGFDKKPVVIVDGRLNKLVENVNPLGQIEFVSRANIRDITLETYNALIYRSKVLTGRYISSHYVFLNGTQIATDLSSLTSWLDTNPELNDKDLIRFVNIQPYARKLERLGVTAQRQNSRKTKSRDKQKRSGTHVLAPNGAYYLTARAIRRKYKRNSTIQFTFISGSSLGIKSGFKSKNGKPGRAYLYPTIVISVAESGIE